MLSARLAHHWVPPPLLQRLRPIREQAADSAVHRFGLRAIAISRGIVDRDAGARAELADLAETALRSMRAEVYDRAATAGGLTAFAAMLDRRFYEPEGREYLDGDVAPAVRERAVGHLDAINRLLGNYEAFRRELWPFLHKHTRVLDVAAGHGGFAIHLARTARDLDLDIHASDVCAVSLGRGRRTAEEAGVQVTFDREDALDLSSGLGAYDVVTSTQALHHFTPGGVARLVSEAARVARSRVILMDGARSALNGLAVTALGTCAFWDWVWTHDTVVSFRRFYTPEELRLLASLAAPHHVVECDLVAPGHCRLLVGLDP